MADPRDQPDGLLAVVRLASPGTCGAPSGWRHRGRACIAGVDRRASPTTSSILRHGDPPATDVVQATVLADSARLAEGFAKFAVHRGRHRRVRARDRPRIHGLLAADDERARSARATGWTDGWCDLPGLRRAHGPHALGPRGGRHRDRGGGDRSRPRSTAIARRVVDGNRASLPWLFERLFAFLAYLAIAGSVVYGLLLSTKVLDRLAHRPVSFLLHKDLAAIGVGWRRSTGRSWGSTTRCPSRWCRSSFRDLAPHATLAVAFGQVSLDLGLVVIGSFYIRRRSGNGTWRTIHYLTFLAFIGATVHGIAAGTDGGSPWASGDLRDGGHGGGVPVVDRVVVSIGRRPTDGRRDQSMERDATA